MTDRIYRPITDADIYAALEKRAAELLKCVQSRAKPGPQPFKDYDKACVQQAWEDFTHDWEAALDQFGNADFDPALTP
jgi:hypothetical protein